jgi:arylsulfatase A-like enzyme
VRSESERRDPHPVYRAFMEHRVSKTFSRDDVRAEVIPVYMGLIKQIDDQMGVLFAFMEQQGLFDNTMVVFTADHGDYLGDHWLGDKDFFHDASVKVPLIIYDPSSAADTTRGRVCDELVEAIDLAPTFLQVAGGDPVQQSHRLEGRSLRPLLHGGQPAAWRPFAVSEYDYGMQPASAELGIKPRDARLFMIADKRWKLIHAIGFRPMLFDLANDPQELHDLGAEPKFSGECERLAAALAQWGLRVSQRTTRSEQQIDKARGKAERRGILIGVWDEADIPAELWSGYLRDKR